MNCHQVRQLISPYLDQQLTGREMLALQDHFAVCASCEREMHSIRQVKLLLRGLRETAVPRDFSGGVALRLAQANGAPRWRVQPLPAPRPQRGRRLVSALALSCLTVVSFAAPFAPEAAHSPLFRVGGPISGSSLFGAPAPSDTLLSGRVPEHVTLVPVSDLTRLSPAEASTSSGGVLTLTAIDAPPLVSGAALVNRDQDMPFGNVQFAVFRPR